MRGALLASLALHGCIGLGAALLLIPERESARLTHQIHVSVEGGKGQSAKRSSRGLAPRAQTPLIPADAESFGSPDASPPRGNAFLDSTLRPEYPLASRRKGEEGDVSVRARVQPDGSVISAEIAQSSGFSRLDQSALEFIRRARFRFEAAPPAGVFEKVVTIGFRLNG